MLSSPAAQPFFIECPSCDGTGTQTEYRGPSSRDYRCEDCDGSGVALCETRRCGEPAIRVVGDMRCCSACAELADADVAAYKAVVA